MMDSFTFPGLTTRVIFGAGTMGRAEEEVRRLGHDKALVLSTPHQKADADKLAQSLGGLAAGVFAGAVMHTPVEVTEKAVDAFRASAPRRSSASAAARPPGSARPSPCAPAPIRW